MTFCCRVGPLYLPREIDIRYIQMHTYGLIEIGVVYDAEPGSYCSQVADQRTDTHMKKLKNKITLYAHKFLEFQRRVRFLMLQS